MVGPLQTAGDAFPAAAGSGRLQTGTAYFKLQPLLMGAGSAERSKALPGFPRVDVLRQVSL
jgi:hypothetical protein